MPPFLPRKRLRSPSPQPEPSASTGNPEGKCNAMPVASISPRKRTLFDALDTPNGQSAINARNLLADLAGNEDDESSELSSLSSSEPEFEDVPSAKWHRIQKLAVSDDEGDGNDEEDGIEFEDVHTSVHADTTNLAPSGDLELTLRKETRISLINPHNKKQGPSKIERQIRIATHCMHVQFLMFHNALRNSWICDSKVQDILVKALDPNIQVEVQRWRIDSGLASKEDWTSKNDKMKKGTKVNERNQRDWGEPAQRLASGTINMSQGDPLFRLLRCLVAYWTKRFRITAPGLRKLGYMPLQELDEEIKSFNKGEYDQERHGERICGIEEFRGRAETCEGNRDLSAQLFTALLRGVGLEARMVVSLQPVGFGWSKNEEASPNRLKRNPNSNSEKEKDSSKEPVRCVKIRSPADSKGKRKIVSSMNASKKSTRRSPLVGSFNGMLRAPSDLEADFTDDDDSVIDVTPSQAWKEVSKLYERDLPPNYWTEVLSPVTNTYIAVNPLNLKNPAATNSDLLASFEPRGVKSENSKQVMAYIIGYSSDGTAKDVTVRYLRRHMFPGKTKGFRMPIERIPVFNKQGKVKHYEEFDWFKTVMSGYCRRGKARTEIDEYEEATDLKAVKPEKKEVKEGEETLQSYKVSTEYVLERHLRREEAILPGVRHVKKFLVKGKKSDEPVEENVFLRKDVVSCKSVETWHKEGREPKLGEQPLKLVPYRAATTNRKRELAEAEAITGEKMLQGLYSRDQTDWIVPPPIVDGRIPKNAYGNMDVFVPSMVPLGAVHLPHRGTKRICQKLGIDFAEAVTGFEFGSRMAIPIITGIVIAAENEELILDQWERDEAERVRKEDEKRKVAALGKWRKFLMGLRIIERVREEYGEELDNNVDELNPWINKNSKNTVDSAKNHIDDHRDEDNAGGFLLANENEEDLTSSFFPMRHEDEDDANEEGGGFIT